MDGLLQNEIAANKKLRQRKNWIKNVVEKMNEKRKKNKGEKLDEICSREIVRGINKKENRRN